MATDDDQPPIGSGVDHAVPPKTPSWVKYLLLGLLVVVVLVVLAMLLVGGEHGPGRHGGSHPAPAGMAGSLVWQ
jgi:hypothetical protein